MSASSCTPGQGSVTQHDSPPHLDGNPILFQASGILVDVAARLSKDGWSRTGGREIAQGLPHLTMPGCDAGMGESHPGSGLVTASGHCGLELAAARMVAATGRPPTTTSPAHLSR